MTESVQVPQQVLVILAAHGEAESAGLREQYAASWRTLHHAAEVMPLSAALRTVICAVGALRKRFGGGAGSRHNAVTRAQADALEAALASHPRAEPHAELQAGPRTGPQTEPHAGPQIAYRVVAAFASSEPGVTAALAAAPPDALVLLCSMIPTDSRLSCGLFCRAAGRQGASAVIRPLARLWEDSRLVDVHCSHVADWLRKHADRAGDTARDDSALVIALHGTLLADRAGRPPAFHNGNEEKTHYGEALRSAMTDLPGRPWQRVEIAYLNHSVGGHWSQPTVEDCLARLAREGFRSVYAYPAEHLVVSLETERLAHTVATSGFAQGYCLPTLGDSPRFIDFLAERVRAAATAKGHSLPCDACPLAALALP